MIERDNPAKGNMNDQQQPPSILGTGELTSGGSGRPSSTSDNSAEKGGGGTQRRDSAVASFWAARSSIMNEGAGPGIKMTPTMKNYTTAKNVEDFLKKEKKEFEKFQREPKLLILGSSDSGKSTLLKQLKIMHGNGFGGEERAEAKSYMYAGIAMTVITLFNRCKEEAGQSSLNTSYGSVLDFLEKYQITEEELLVGYKDSLKSYWNEPVVQNTFKTNTHNILPDTTAYFMNDLDRILAYGFSPMEQDILNVRVVTRQISDTIFNINNQRVHFYDVSGLKHDRCHWIQFFDNVTTILFVASLSSYDQTLLEDPTINRMADSLVLFESMANHKLLKTKPFILFLNKKDLFKKKIDGSPITNTFPDFTGDAKSHSQSGKFICNKFQSQVAKDRQLTLHVTMATDKASMTVIIKEMMEEILRKDLAEMGLIKS